MGNGLKRLSALSALFVLFANAAFAACNPDELWLRGAWGQARFGIELADDAAERARGLMHRESLPKSHGMLFVYEAPVEAAFWMRNTLISLDMIFIDERGVVTHVHERAEPLSEEIIPSRSKILAVLEINGGLAELYGISQGTEVQHESFDQSSAAWACER